MIETGSTSRYLLYAIGEIALVVIGILIALQINNWNQDQKEKAYEDNMLLEIYGSLQLDSARFDMFFEPRVKLKKQGIDSLLSFIHFNKNVENDTVLKYYRQLYYSPQITVNFGPYETLKSNGLEKIKNDEIRLWLVDLYDSFLPRQIFFIQEEIKRHESKILVLDNELIQRNSTRVSPNGELYVSKTLRSENFLRDSRTLYFIELHYIINREQISRLNKMKKALHATLEKLRDQFNSNKGFRESNKGKKLTQTYYDE